MTLADQLKRMPLFSSLTDGQRESLAARSLAASCPKGKILFTEGEEAAGLYILLEGKVKIFRAAPDGREAVLHIFGPGEPFGEVAVFQGGRFPASAECVEAGTSLFVPRKALLEGISNDPALALNMLAALSLRLRAFAAKVETLTLMETPQRLAAYLLQLPADKGNRVELPFSQRPLAASLGIRAETLSRLLSEWRMRCWIRGEKRIWALIETASLQNLAGGCVRSFEQGRLPETSSVRRGPRPRLGALSFCYANSRCGLRAVSVTPCR